MEYHCVPRRAHSNQKDTPYNTKRHSTIYIPPNVCLPWDGRDSSSDGQYLSAIAASAEHLGSHTTNTKHSFVAMSSLHSTELEQSCSISSPNTTCQSLANNTLLANSQKPGSRLFCDIVEMPLQEPAVDTPEPTCSTSVSIRAVSDNDALYPPAVQESNPSAQSQHLSSTNPTWLNSGNSSIVHGHSQNNPSDLNKLPCSESNTSLSKICSVFGCVGGRIWNGIDYVSNVVADLLGITSPRYELWFDEARKYQQQMDSEQKITYDTFEDAYPPISIKITND
ncbi:hypothetical protein QVD99_001823 [Batrachochytrium dendrobatidis]|nr:hypothetical protein O5D80_000466 [Batrachochytrium dendrobatidis]KAK5672004.1 hypothetical protein QVD99_001823 [Batrachochytrium dendrobatidis]